MNRQQQSKLSAYFRPRIPDDEYQQQLDRDVRQQQRESEQDTARRQERLAIKRLRENTSQQVKRRPGRPRVQPDQIKVDVGLYRMKPLLVKWMMTAWKALRERKGMIKSGWTKAGFGKVMLPEFQLESTNMIITGQLSIRDKSQLEEEDCLSSADIEQRYEDVERDDDDEVADDEEEVNIDDALIAFIEETPVVGVRRSARLQQRESERRDYRVASLLQQEVLQEAVCR